MKAKQPVQLQSRRRFIQRGLCAAFGAAAFAPILEFPFSGTAMAQSAITDYKALVYVFLAGGNDANNLIIPTLTAEYNNYAALRTSVLALPQSALLPIAPANNDGHTYGLHPSCPELQTLFGEGKLAILFNTGPLAAPLTLAQYLAGAIAKPIQLFSHEDQQTEWQTCIADQFSMTGWGGRCADILSATQPNTPVPLSMTLAGSNTFETGNVVSPYAVSPSGAVALTSVTGTRLQAMTNILGKAYPNLQAQTYANVAQHAINTSGVLNNAIQPTSGSYWSVSFHGTQLGSQLNMIARLIEAGHRGTGSGGFGLTRQIFFCQVGGYDLHTGQTGGPGQTTIGAHASLLADVSQCFLAFQRAMEQLGLSNNVATFTGSDFSRTLASNGQGSDHAWGGHHLVLGGAVKGKRTYGTFPTLAINGPDDINGCFIPTTSTDQYSATLATWFGIDAANLATVFPNLSRFSTPNLGFI